MAYGDGDRVEGVNVELAFRELDLRRQHASDLLLVRLAVAGEDDLHLRRLVFEHGYAALLEQRLARGILGEQSAEVARDEEQASAIRSRIRDDRFRGKDGARPGQQREARAGKPGVNPQYQSVRVTWHLSTRVL